MTNALEKMLLGNPSQNTNLNENSTASDVIRLNSMSDFMAAVSTSTAELSQTNTLSFSTKFSALTLNRALLSNAFLDQGIIQTIVQQPVDDALRGGIDIFCEELSADDIADLQHYIEQNNILLTYGQGLKWARLFGGAGIIINAGQVWDKPLNIESIKEWTPLTFHAVDRWELGFMPQGMVLDQLEESMQDVPYNYYGKRLHKDNVIKLNNKQAPSLIRGQFGGWGVSEVEHILRSYNQYLKNQNVCFELLDEARVDVFKLQGMNAALATKRGSELTAQRITAAAQLKNYQNALAIDKDDDYDFKQMSYAGLAEILNQVRIQLASDCHMPLTKLFGLSASGFNSGEDDIENYNAMIESEVRSKIKAGLLVMLKVVCKKLFGIVPENMRFEFKPLRIIGHKDESDIKTQALNRIISGYQNGLYHVEKAIELINAEKIYPVELTSADAMTIEELADMKSAIDQMPIIPGQEAGARPST